MFINGDNGVPVFFNLVFKISNGTLSTDVVSLYLCGLLYLSTRDLVDHLFFPQSLTDQQMCCVIFRPTLQTITLCLLLIFSINVQAAGQAAGSDPKPEQIRTKYIQAVELIKSAKKYEKKR